MSNTKRPLGDEPLRRCPKCRSVDIVWIEYGTWQTEFQQDASGIDEDGNHEPGNYTHLYGVCTECRHRWRPRNGRGRGAVQIWDVPGGFR